MNIKLPISATLDKNQHIIYHRAGIGFGEWQKPWDRMSERERQGAVMERVKKNIEH